MNNTATNSTLDTPCLLLYCVFSLSTVERVIIIVLMLSIAVISLFGNSLVCCAYVTSKKKNSTMTLSSLNVAVSNILLTIFWGPSVTAYFYIVGKWVFGSVMCKLMAFMQHTAVVASLLHLLAVTVEKYRAVCFPYAFRRERKVVYYSSIVVSWCIAIGASGYYASFKKTKTIDGGATYFCMEDWPADDTTFVAVVLANTVFFFLTLLVVIVLLALTIYELTFGKGNFRPGTIKTGDESRSRKRARQARAVKILAVMLVSVLVCWTPFHTLNIVALQGHTKKISARDFHLVFAAFVILFFSVCTVHPLVFFFINKRGRDLMQGLWQQSKTASSSRRGRSSSESTNLSLRAKPANPAVVCDANV